MLNVLLKHGRKSHSFNKIKITNEVVEKLKKGKKPIVCKDGEVKIDADHPDYNFWMED